MNAVAGACAVECPGRLEAGEIAKPEAGSFLFVIRAVRISGELPRLHTLRRRAIILNQCLGMFVHDGVLYGYAGDVCHVPDRREQLCALVKLFP